MDVSVVIVNYNTCQITRDCIDSVLFHTKDVSYEIILVDNRSTDGSKDYFESLDKEGVVRYIYSFENMGFGRANNVGMMLAKGKYIFLLNSDTLLENNAIKIFFDYAESSDKMNFYGSWLLNNKQEIILSYGEEPSLASMLKTACNPYLIALGLKKKNKKYHGVNPLYGKAYEVGYISGADMFFTREIVEKFGAFDHNFFMYKEEAEWQKRLKTEGIKSYIIPGPQIIHLEGGSDDTKKSSRPSIKSLAMQRNSRNYFLKKHYHPFQYIPFKIVYNMLYYPYLILSRHYFMRDIIKYVFGYV